VSRSAYPGAESDTQTIVARSSSDSYHDEPRSTGIPLGHPIAWSGRALRIDAAVDQDQNAVDHAPEVPETAGADRDHDLQDGCPVVADIKPTDAETAEQQPQDARDDLALVG
jgi:hypothetical protein